MVRNWQRAEAGSKSIDGCFGALGRAVEDGYQLREATVSDAQVRRVGRRSGVTNE